MDHWILFQERMYEQLLETIRQSAILVSSVAVFASLHGTVTVIKLMTTKDKPRMKKNYYELLYIINPVLDEEKFKGVIETVTGLIEAQGGEIEETDDWGVRKLAYDMDGKRTGYYVNVYFEAAGEAIEKLERSFRLNDDIMRYLTIKYDAKMKRHRELVKKGEKPTIFEDVEESEEEES